MAWTKVQSGNNDAGSGTTLSATGSVGAITSGNLVVGAAVAEYSALPTLTVKTSNGTTCNIKSNLNSTGDSTVLITFILGNVTDGSNAITLTSSTAQLLFLVWEEWSGGFSASDPTDGTAFAAAQQGVPGAGTNAINSGSITTTTSGDLIWAASIDTGTNSTFTAGTSPLAYALGVVNNFSGIGTLQAENAVQATAGALTNGGTFSNASGASDNYITGVIAIKPASTAVTAVGSTLTLMGVG